MLERRSFIKKILAISLASSFVSHASSSHLNNHTSKTLPIKPKRLKVGDTIGLIAPASNVWEDEEINFAIEIIESLGLKVKKGKFLYQRNGYFAGNDHERAWDVNNMFSDQTVDGIFCIRGGYGSPRILPFLNYDLIKNNPKVLVGYSDITALLNAITAKTGLITFHGPIANQIFTSYTLKNFKAILFAPHKKIDLATAPSFEKKEGQVDQDNRVIVINSGKATGQLIGGNLSLMVKLIGSEFEPDYKGKILFLEDVDEAPYRIDGMLTHLWLAGRLNEVSGIIFGKCTDCIATEAPSFSVEHVLRDRFSSLDVPVISGLMIGHIENMATIPVGAMATLDTESKKLILDESAVQ